MVGKVALITGINGQDGSYLCDLLVAKGYHVHGLIRSSTVVDSTRLEKITERSKKQDRTFNLHYGDLADSEFLLKVIREIRPDEIYNLAAQSQVGASFASPESTMDVNGMGVLRLLDAIRLNKLSTRLFQAASSELFGKVSVAPQNEGTPFHPRSPYAVAKLYGYWMVRNYRESYGIHASNGILFNHESPRRGEGFVTRKITLSLARIKAGLQSTLRLGNLDAKRDWGFAGDFVEMMWMMLQQPDSDDFIAATGETHTVKEFIERAAAIAGFAMEWEGKEEKEVGRDKKSGRIIVETDPQFYRPNEAVPLQGNPSKAKAKLGWEPKVNFDQLVEMMMNADLEAISALKQG